MVGVGTRDLGLGIGDSGLTNSVKDISVSKQRNVILFDKIVPNSQTQVQGTGADTRIPWDGSVMFQGRFRKNSLNHP